MKKKTRCFFWVRFYFCSNTQPNNRTKNEKKYTCTHQRQQKSMERDKNAIHKCILLRPQASILSMFSTTTTTTHTKKKNPLRWYSFWCVFLMRDDSFWLAEMQPKRVSSPSSCSSYACVVCNCKSWKSFIGIGKWLISSTNTSTKPNSIMHSMPMSDECTIFLYADGFNVFPYKIDSFQFDWIFNFPCSSPRNCRCQLNRCDEIERERGRARESTYRTRWRYNENVLLFAFAISSRRAFSLHGTLSI